MGKNIKLIKCNALLLIFVLSLSLFLSNFTIQSHADETDVILLGKFQNNHFVAATGKGSKKFKGLVIGFSNKVSNEKIVLPAVSGYTNDSNLSTENYSYIVRFDEDKTVKQIAEEYIRNIEFQNTTTDTEIYAIMTENVPAGKTIYRAANNHFYQYVNYFFGDYSGTGKTWMECYNEAKTMTFAGRQGYLATITSVEEDRFVHDASMEVGWLGGTRILKPDVEDGDMFYTYPDPGDNDYDVSNTTNRPWYWACGPERGQIFYNRATTTTVNRATHDAENIALGYYFNWNRAGVRYEPSNQGGENCLSTLRIENGYATTDISNYSWNDLPQKTNVFTPYNEYKPHGFFVEYGNLTEGNDDNLQIANSDLLTYFGFAPHTLTFDLNEGDSLSFDSKIIATGESYGGLPTATKAGKRLLGWFTEPDGGTEVKANDLYMLREDQTLYAHWIDVPVEPSVDEPSQDSGATNTVAKAAEKTGSSIMGAGTPAETQIKSPKTVGADRLTYRIFLLTLMALSGVGLYNEVFQIKGEKHDKSKLQNGVNQKSKH